jgi:hypothetical protein
VSDEEDLETQALQRQLDDAFQTTRPRRGFEDELWSSIEARRPWSLRLWAFFAALVGGVRRVPPAPAAAVAILLVLVLGIGLLGSLGRRGGAGGTTSLSEGPQRGGANYNPVAGDFGRLPMPFLLAGSGVNGAVPPKAESAAPAQARANNLYFGPANLIWAGQLNMAVSSAPVYRFQAPSTDDANKFATSIGAAAQPGQADLSILGSYSSPDFTLTVAYGTRVPNREPFYFLTPTANSSAPGSTAGDVAGAYLSTHRLTPIWPSSVVVDQSGSRVQLLRQFDVAGAGPVFLIDGVGDRYGLDVHLNGNNVVQIKGPMPLLAPSAGYRIISAGQAVQSALASSPSGVDRITPTPTVRLTSAELVYALVWAGDHSFYEPAYLFSGTFSYNGTTYVKRVLVPAVDPSQLLP